MRARVRCPFRGAYWCAVFVVVICGAWTQEEVPVTIANEEIQTHIACETTSLDVNCGEGKVIRFHRANYGRTSSSPCNPGGYNLTDNCISASSNETMFLKCDGRRTCDVVSSNYIFQDPCIGTEKYLEMVYECIDGEDPAVHAETLMTAPTAALPRTSLTIDYDLPQTMPPTQEIPQTRPPSVVPTSIGPPLTTTANTQLFFPPAALLYCNSQDLRMLDLDTSRETVLASGLNRSVVVDYDYAREIFVWTDSKLKSIFSAPMSGGDSSKQRKLLAENVTSYGIAVDWIHGNVYWTDTGNDVISVARLDGSMKRSLFTSLLDEPRGIVLHPNEGYMYWSDWGEVPKIEKSGMDGSKRKVIVSYGLKWPNGLAIDIWSRRLFWIEAFHENLCSSGLEGEDVKKIITSSPYLKLPFSVDIYQDYVYWTEWTSNKENIFKAHRVTGRNITKVLDGETTLMGIKIYHISKQPLTLNNCGDNNGGCAYLCLPSPGVNETKYSCACPNGMQLQSDGLNCSTSADFLVSLLYCNRHDIRKYDLGTQKDSAMMTGLERATVIDYHFKNKVAVWTDTDRKKIYRAQLWQAGARPTVLAESVTSYGIALDWIHDHVYWTDTHNNMIDVASLDGSMRKNLFKTDLDEPRAIVLNPSEGFMFWSDWGEVPKIERSAMDGTHRRVIISRDIRWPNGLAIDFDSRKIFWVDGKLNYLSVADFDGGNRRNLISSASVMRHPFSLDVYGEYLFWVEWSSGKESIFKASKVDGSHVSKVFDGERTLMGLKVLEASKQPEGNNACGDDNGGCSHLCLPAPGINQTTTFSCACPNNLYMTRDNFNCSTTAGDPFDNSQVDNTTLENKAVLFCANVDDIRVIDLSTYQDHRLIGDLTRAVAVDYVYENKIILWTDIREDRICSAPIRTNGLATELVDDCLHPDGLAVDWIHGHMYWTDKGKDAVGVANLDGTMEKTLFANDLDEPRAIALDPFEGWMFWTDWGRVPKIERAGMDGTGRSVIVSRLIQWPNGVAVDLTLRKIYWADAKTHEICRANYDGSERKTVLSSYTLLKQPFSIDVFQDSMYWVEWRSGEESIYKADKNSGGNVLKIADGRKWRNLMTIKVYHSSKQPPGPNKCGVTNGGCSHLCLPSPRLDNSTATYKCACPNSLQLAYNARDCLTEMKTTTMMIPTESETIISNSTERPFLLYANKRDVRKMDLLTKEDTLLADGYSRASGIDYHYEQKLVVWTDYESGQIYSAPLWSGSPVRPITLGNTSSNGVAVDWVHGHVYWTDNKRNSIDVAKLDGSMRRTLFKGGDVDEPRTIVLHPEDGWIFWADWGRLPKIERAGMDGTNRKTIVQTGVDWTHALAVDLNIRKIYWADGDQKKIFSVNFDGSGKLTLLSAPDLLHLPFSMDILQDNLYWTEFMPLAENIYKVNKLTGKNPIKVVTMRWPNLMSIKIYHSSKQPNGTNRCSTNNGGCSHLCLPTPRLPEVLANFTCSCPNGMIKMGSDCFNGGTVIIPSSFTTTTASPSTFSLSTPSVSTEVNEYKFEDNQSGFISEKTNVPVGGIIIGSIAVAALIALVGVIVYYRHFLRRNFGNMVFNNPLYRKHTEDDFCIETHSSATGSKSLVPLTSAESGEMD